MTGTTHVENGDPCDFHLGILVFDLRHAALRLGGVKLDNVTPVFGVSWSSLSAENWIFF